MSEDASVDSPDGHKSRDQLIAEVAELRAELASERARGRRSDRTWASLEAADIPDVEKRFLSLFELHNDPMFVIDPEGRIMAANAAACSNLGYTREELLQMTPEEIDTPEYAGLVQEKLKAIRSKGQLVFEASHRRKNGTDFPVEVSSSRFPYNGRICVLSVVKDITERRRTEEALRCANERLEAHLENSPLAIIEFDADYRVIRWSGAAELVFGWKSDEIVGKVMTEMRWVHEEDEAKVALLAVEIAAGRLPRSVSVNRNYHKDGRIIHCEWYNSAVYNQTGKLTSVFSQVLDITERERTEGLLRQLNETLEQQVAERSRLAEARSRQLQALAVELIEAEERERRRFAELLHDDLQQLLAAARLQLQTACQGLPTVPGLESANRLLEETLGKARRLSHELSPPALSHAGLVGSLKWLAAQMHKQFGLQVEMEVHSAQRFEGTHLKVFLFRAVQELLFNVVKHAGVRKARILLSSSVDCLDITVSDRGCGFHPGTLNGASSSAGFGLLTLRERASYVGGSLVIESTPGRGSRFTLTIPFDLDQGSKPRRRATDRKVPVTSVPAVAAAAGDLRVLFVDDHKVMRNGLIQLMSGKPNIQVVGEAENGCEAIERVRQLRPDVIVMDVSMPKMDGIEATRRIKEEYPDMRVIGLSMFGDDIMMRTMCDAGAEAVVSKTASSAELLKAIYGSTADRG